MKDTNPKDAISTDKLDLGLVPDTSVIYEALAFTEGACKYGRYNWRIAGVRASVYHAACRRHLAKYWNGEWADLKTGIPHLASAKACLGVLLDAHVQNKLMDDRPPMQSALPVLIDSLEEQVKKLKETFKNHTPYQFVIGDNS